MTSAQRVYVKESRMPKIRKRSKKWAKRYYSEHKADYKRRAEKWKLNDPIGFREVRLRASRKFTRTPKGIFHALQQNSRKRGRIFNLSRIEFILWYESREKICLYCSKPQEKDKRLEIDRMDNSIGYVLSNMTLACSDCNEVKGSTLTCDEMKIIGKLVMKKRWQN